MSKKKKPKKLISIKDPTNKGCQITCRWVLSENWGNVGDYDNDLHEKTKNLEWWYTMTTTQMPLILCF